MGTGVYGKRRVSNQAATERSGFPRQHAKLLRTADLTARLGSLPSDYIDGRGARGGKNTRLIPKPKYKVLSSLAYNQGGGVVLQPSYIEQPGQYHGGYGLETAEGRRPSVGGSGFIEVHARSQTPGLFAPTHHFGAYRNDGATERAEALLASSRSSTRGRRANQPAPANDPRLPNSTSSSALPTPHHAGGARAVTPESSRLGNAPEVSPANPYEARYVAETQHPYADRTVDATLGDPAAVQPPPDYRDSMLDMDRVAKLSGKMHNHRFPKTKYEQLKFDKSFNMDLSQLNVSVGEASRH